MFNENIQCDALWLPACPRCSQVNFWRRPALDDLAIPFFRLARHTSARDGVNSWTLFGCNHAFAIAPHPIRNRLRLAVRWRREAARLLGESFLRGYTDDQRAIIVRRLSYQYQEPAT